MMLVYNLFLLKGKFKLGGNFYSHIMKITIKDVNIQYNMLYGQNSYVRNKRMLPLIFVNFTSVKLAYN